MATDAEDPLTRASRRQFTWMELAWVLFPAAAWMVAILWLGGDIGRSADDYSVNMRDPETGAVPSPFNPWARYPFFWRPLHNAMCFGLGTIFAENWRVLMVFCAVMHGLACIGVYALLRAGTRLRGPAAIGALALLVHPMNFEVAFWFCSTSAAIATAMWCGLALWCTKLVCRKRFPRGIELAGVAALGLVIPCFYEQPASGVLALPFILLGAWLAAENGPRLAAAFVRAMVLCGIVGTMNVVYIVLLRLTAPASFRGGSGSFVGPERVAERISQVARSVHWQLYGNRLRQTTLGAWETGLEALATPVGIAAIGGMAVLACIWAWAWWSGAPGGEGADSTRGVSRRLGAAARASWIGGGAILFLGAFIPIALMDRQNVEPRTLYFPLVGLCVILAQLLDVLLGLLPRAGRGVMVSRSVRAAVGLVTGGGVILAAICCVGIQTWAHRREDRDATIARQLVELLPNPPVNAAYLPMRLDSGPTSTGYLLFDRLRPAAFSTTWSATALMQESTRRSDISSASINPWVPLPYHRFSAEGVWSRVRLNTFVSAHRGEGEFVPWDRAVPFTIDDDGRVRLVRQIEITRSDDRVETFVMPVVRAAAREGHARGRATTIALMDAGDPPARPVTGWRWIDARTGQAGETIGMLALDSRGTKREGVWLHPTYQDASRAAMQAEIEASPEARMLRLRITTPPEDFARFAGSMPVRVMVDVVSTGDEAVAAALVELTRELAEAEPKWVPLDITIPASDTPLVMRVRIAGGAKGPFAPVWIMPGIWIDAAP